MECYTPGKVEEACTIHETREMLGHPTNQDFLGMVHSGMITNCPMSPTAMLNASHILGSNLTGVSRGMVRRPPESVTANYVQIPRALLEQHQKITLAGDTMFVNGVHLLGSVSRGLNLVTAECTTSCIAKQLVAGITRVMGLYSSGGSHVGIVLMVYKLKKLRNLVSILVVNTMAAKENVPEVEQCIQLIKEQGRRILNTLLFKKIPLIILIELIEVKIRLNPAFNKNN